MKLNLLFFWFLFLIFSVGIVNAATFIDVQIPLSGDTYVDEANPANAFHTQTFLRANNTAGDHEYTYLDFNFDGFDIADITNANLTLTSDGEEMDTVCVVEITEINNTWNEDTLVYNNKFDPTSVSNSTCFSKNVGTDQPVSINVTSIVQQGFQKANSTNNHMTLYLNVSTIGGRVVFHSNNTATLSFKPNLTLNYKNTTSSFQLNGNINITPQNPTYNTNVSIFANITNLESSIVSVNFTLLYPNGTAFTNLNGTNGTYVSFGGNTTNWTSHSAYIGNNTGIVGDWAYSLSGIDSNGDTISDNGNFAINHFIAFQNFTRITPQLLGQTTSINITIEKTDTNITVNNVTMIYTNSSGYVFYHTPTTNTTTGPLTTIYNVELNLNNSVIGLNTISWNATYTLLNTSGFDFQAGNQNQLVNEPNFALCNTTNTNVTVNITFQDEINNTILNETLEATIFFWSGERNVNQTLTFESASHEFSYAFCFDQSQEFKAEGIFRYTKDGYDPREYYFKNRTMTNTHENITFYSLLIALGTETIIRVVDDVDTPIPGAHIIVERYNIGNNTYRVVSMGVSDEEGKDVMFLRHGDAFYRFTVDGKAESIKSIIQGNSTPEFQSETKKITGDQTFRILPLSTAEIITRIRGIIYEITNDSSTFFLAFDDPTGQQAQHCLVYQKKTFSNQSESPAENCTVGFSGGLSLPYSGDGIHIATYWVSINPQSPIDWKVLELRTTIIEKLGLLGAFLSFFLVAVAAFVGIEISIVAGILFPLVVAILLSGVGIMPWTYDLAVYAIVVMITLLVKGGSS